MLSDIYDPVALDRLFFSESWLCRWSIQYEDVKGEVTERDIMPVLRIVTGTEPGIAAWCYERKSVRYFTYAGIMYYQKAAKDEDDGEGLNPDRMAALSLRLSEDNRHKYRLRDSFMGPMRIRHYPEHLKLKQNLARQGVLEELFDMIDASPTLVLGHKDPTYHAGVRPLDSHRGRERFIAEFLGIDFDAYQNEKELLYAELCEDTENREKRAARTARSR
jgi:hypothetical protein